MDLKDSRKELSAIKQKQKEEEARNLSLSRKSKKPKKADDIKDYTMDARFSEKFGKLKKACVLYNYGRINDAFDEIAHAAKIVQEQQEINKEKQRILEKRWKFKLGMDDGFELPMLIEQIDVNKIDDAFLRKIDIPGVSIQTVKIFIEQVAPQKVEEFSKHKFLDDQIEQFYMQTESALNDKQQTIKKMKQ